MFGRGLRGAVRFYLATGHSEGPMWCLFGYGSENAVYERSGGCSR